MSNSSTIERERQANEFLRYKLRWRRNYLLVDRLSTTRAIYLSVLDGQRWLVERLKLSSVKGVCLDATLGEAEIKLWADACAQANKTVFLRLPAQMRKVKRQNTLGGQLQESLERAIAALLILLFSPFFLALFCVSSLRSLNPLSCDRQWYVSKQGKLFRLYKFRAIATANPKLRENDSKRELKNLSKRYGHLQPEVVEQWLHKNHFDRLPQLFNTLRGEIGLVERQYLTLEQAVRLSLDKDRLIETRHQEPQSECSVDNLRSVGVE